MRYTDLADVVRLEDRERAADRALWEADPQFAASLGIEPPLRPTWHPMIVERRPGEFLLHPNVRGGLVA